MEETQQQQPQPPVQPAQPTEPSPVHTLILPMIMIGVCSAFLAGFGVYVYMSMVADGKEELLKQQTIISPTPEAQAQQIPSPSPETNVPANWKTYTNVQYGVEIKYPDTYLVADKLSRGYNVIFYSSEEEMKKDAECIANKLAGCNINDFSLGIQFKVDEQTPFDEYLKQMKKIGTETHALLTVDGYPAFQTQSEAVGINNELFINKGTYSLQIKASAFLNAEQSMENYKIMLSSMQFLE